MATMHNCYNIEDIRTKAQHRLPRGVWEYLERGVEDEMGMLRNRAAFDAISFVPRIARNVSAIDTSHQIFGTASALPLAVAPTGAAGMMWHKGDLRMARAAAGAGIPFTISSASTMDIEEIAVAGGRLWFQLYLWENRQLSYEVVERAKDLGAEALLVTMDLPVMPNREYLHRSGFGMPFSPNHRNIADMLLHPRWLAGVVGRYMLEGGVPSQGNLPPHLKSKVTRGAKPGALFKQDSLDWEEIRLLRDKWPGRLVLKGVLHPDDARKAAEIGADGIVVSNHGARALDGSIASMTALPAIVETVSGRLTVFLDSGVRRGSDVVKALALGADGVLAGRAPLYGLAAGGEAGTHRAIELLGEEIKRCMGMLGVTSIDQITPDALAR